MVHPEDRNARKQAIQENIKEFLIKGLHREKVAIALRTTLTPGGQLLKTGLALKKQGNKGRKHNATHHLL
mgnify:CR=1 FL=1